MMDCKFENSEAVLAKVREKGFSNDVMDNAYTLNCQCGEVVEMTTFETMCPSCGGIFVVTPCSQDSIDNVVFVK